VVHPSPFADSSPVRPTTRKCAPTRGNAVPSLRLLAFRAQYVPNLTPRCELRSANGPEPEGERTGPDPLLGKSQDALLFPDSEGRNRRPYDFARPWHAARAAAGRDDLKFRHDGRQGQVDGAGLSLRVTTRSRHSRQR
jgi:hypothetical protein